MRTPRVAETSSASEFRLLVEREDAIERLHALEDTASSGVRGVRGKVGIVEASNTVMLVPPGGQEWGQGSLGVVAHLRIDDEDPGSRVKVRVRLGEASAFTLATHGGLALVILALWLLPLQENGPWPALLLMLLLLDLGALAGTYTRQRRLLSDVVSRALGPVKDEGDVSLAPPYR